MLKLPLLKRGVLVTLASLAAALTARAETFELSKATIPEIQAAVAKGALTYEKLVSLYLARIEAYDQKGPALNTVITLNPQALALARALDEERKAKGPRSPLHGIPVLVKDNFDTKDLPTTGGAFFLEGNVTPDESFMTQKLRDAGAIILAKVNLDEFAAGGIGFSSLGGQTRNPHDPARHPAGSSGATGAGLAAWFAPLGLGTDTGGSIRGPCAFNGVPGIKPTNGLLSRAGIIPRVLSFDTGGPMARSVYDVALSLGFMTGVDPADPLTQKSAGLAYTDYTIFLKKGSLKGARIGVLRELMGQDPEVDAIFNRAVEELKKQGAIVVDPIKYPDFVMQSRTSVMEAIRLSDIREQYALYLANLKPGFPKTLGEMIERADALKAPQGKYQPHPELYARFKIENAGHPSTSTAYRAGLNGMAMIRDGIQGVMEKHQLDAIVYATRPIVAPLIKDTPRGVNNPAQSLTNLANISQFPDVIVPAGATQAGLPVTLSFLGPAFSEPKLLAYAYDYEQANPYLKLPSTTPALPGEVFKY